MKIRNINADSSPPPTGGYSQAMEVTMASRTLFISGQIPLDSKGYVPKSFDEQARIVWTNIENQLSAADMEIRNIIKVSTFLSSREHREANSKIRQEYLQSHAPALTVLISDIYDENWLLEIEVIAMA